jgi:hypothetical protein
MSEEKTAFAIYCKGRAKGGEETTKKLENLQATIANLAPEKADQIFIENLDYIARSDGRWIASKNRAKTKEALVHRQTRARIAIDTLTAQADKIHAMRALINRLECAMLSQHGKARQATRSKIRAIIHSLTQ